MADVQWNLWRGWRVVFALGWGDFALKYRGSVLGYFWSLAGPIVRFLVILYIFGPLVQKSIPQYPLYLFLGIIIWEHFSLTTTGCMNMPMEKSGIIQRIPFPLILLILAAGWTNIIIFASHLLIFFIFGWYFGADVGWSLLYLPVIIIQMSLVALGVGMFLAAFRLKYRDIPHLWNIAVQILFWLTPVMYLYGSRTSPVAAFLAFVKQPGTPALRPLLDSLIHTQPLAMIIHDARRVVLYPVAAGIPTVMHAVVLSCVCAVIFVAGKWVFDWRSRYFNQEY